jgi:two-component system, OmpR family, alkaline phosphatase synthesis response regulator PhoP
MTKNILVIEDDKDVVDVVRYFLERENFRVHIAKDGFTGLEVAGKVMPNLILLDLTIPKLDGIEVCKNLKADKRLGDVPVIMVTARVEEADKIRGLELGADDYISKPFSPKELVARVRAVLRRREGTKPESKFHYGNIAVDVVKHEVFSDGNEVEVTSKEFELLVYLIENKGRVLTRDMILNHVWGYNYFGTTRTVDVHVTHLRQKVSLLADALMTVKPLGYKLKENPEE